MTDHFENLAGPRAAGESLDARMEAIRNSRIEMLEKSLTAHRKFVMVCIVMLVAIGVWTGQSVLRTGNRLAEAQARMVTTPSPNPVDSTPAPSGPADVVQVRRLELMDAEGKVALRLTAGGTGTLSLATAGGQSLVEIGADEGGDGMLVARSADGREAVRVAAAGSGGQVRVGGPAGGQAVQLLVNQAGAVVAVYNRDGTAICTMNPDEDGNGIVGAWNKADGGQALRGVNEELMEPSPTMPAATESESAGAPQS